MEKKKKKRYWENQDELVGTVTGADTENRLKCDEEIENGIKSQECGGEKLNIKGKCGKAEWKMQARKTVSSA